MVFKAQQNWLIEQLSGNNEIEVHKLRSKERRREMS
jgi:hypothetical protein